MHFINYKKKKENNPLKHFQEKRSFGVVALSKSYNGRQIVKNVSFSVHSGEIVGILGPNGAGKTTCFYMAVGLIRPDRGHIEIDGKDVSSLPMYQLARLGVGYLPQESSVFRKLTVEENILAVLERKEKNKKKRFEICNELLEEFKITHLRKSLALALSGGERRRLEIARALALSPKFILLDEPFAGVDPIAVNDIQELVKHLKKRNIGVLITDHNVREMLELIERAYIIYDGKVLTEGAVEEIIKDPLVKNYYLGDRFTL